MLLDDELFDDDELEDELLDEDAELDEPEPDDGGSAGCAGLETGVCGCEEAMLDDGFPPQATEAMRRKSITTTNAKFV